MQTPQGPKRAPTFEGKRLLVASWWSVDSKGTYFSKGYETDLKNRLI